MKVLILHDIPELGRTDEIKEVAEGYARNFLFPRHLAIQVSPKILEAVALRQRQKAKAAKRDLYESEQLAGKIDGLEIELKEKANKENVLYAAVTAQKVATALAERGFKVDKTQIIMNPIKEIGEYPARIKFRHGLEAEIRVLVNLV